MGDKLKNKSNGDGYTVKYFKADMDDVVEMAELSMIVTKSIQSDGDIILLSKDKYTFLERMFLVVEYMERNPE